MEKKVIEIVKRCQEERHKEFIEDYQHEIAQGALTKETVQQEAEEDRLQYDSRRTTKGTRHKTHKSDLERYLRALRIYELTEHGCNPKQIAEITKHPGAWEKYIKSGEENKISSAHNKDRNLAKKLITAALQGKSPLAA